VHECPFKHCGALEAGRFFAAPGPGGGGGPPAPGGGGGPPAPIIGGGGGGPPTQNEKDKIGGLDIHWISVIKNMRQTRSRKMQNIASTAPLIVRDTGKSGYSMHFATFYVCSGTDDRALT
jgi:hypothetical protein